MKKTVSLTESFMPRTQEKKMSEQKPIVTRRFAAEEARAQAIQAEAATPKQKFEVGVKISGKIAVEAADQAGATAEAARIVNDFAKGAGMRSSQYIMLGVEKLDT